MEAKQLRIGNLVSYRGEIFEVFDLISKSYVELDSEKLDRHINNADLNNIYPVDISEEILLKVGFEKKGNEISIDGHCFEYWGDDLHYTAGEGLALSPIIKTLHQLQNFIYAISGKELNTEGLI